MKNDRNKHREICLMQFPVSLECEEYEQIKTSFLKENVEVVFFGIDNEPKAAIFTDPMIAIGKKLIYDIGVGIITDGVIKALKLLIKFSLKKMQDVRILKLDKKGVNNTTKVGITIRFNMDKWNFNMNLSSNSTPEEINKAIDNLIPLIKQLVKNTSPKNEYTEYIIENDFKKNNNTIITLNEYIRKAKK